MKPLLQFTTALAAAVWLTPAAALEFKIETIPLAPEQKVTFLPYVHERAGEPALVVIETPDLGDRERQIQGLIAEPARTISLFRRNGQGWELTLRQQMDYAMDIVDILRSADGVQLAGYRPSELMVLRPASRRFEPVLEARSMYVGSTWEPLPGIRLFQDLNDDGLDDFLLPSFEGWQVALQAAEGFNTLQTLGPGPRMDFGDTAELVGYRAETPYLLDENGDGRRDLAFWINGRFEVHHQRSDGTFTEQAFILDPDMKDVLGSFMSVEIGEGEGDDEAPQRMLDAVGDVDGDGLADLIVQAVEGDGIFGLETSYQIHRGVLGSDGRLGFETQASSVVASDGIQLENERLDLTGDGAQEFVVTSVDVSLGAIIGALLTRSASVDVAIYRMVDGVFAAEPSLKKRIKVRFNFGDGELFVPAVLSADVNGDGRKDLLVQKDEDTLFVYPGEPGDRLFQQSPVRLELSLPREREGFLVSDLDQDGRDELVLHLKREGQSMLSVVAFGA